MPKMDGFEFAERFAQYYRDDHTVLIGSSAIHEEDFRKAPNSKLFKYFLEKPIMKSKLEAFLAAQFNI